MKQRAKRVTLFAAVGTLCLFVGFWNAIDEWMYGIADKLWLWHNGSLIDSLVTVGVEG